MQCECVCVRRYCDTEGASGALIPPARHLEALGQLFSRHALPLAGRAEAWAGVWVWVDPLEEVGGALVSGGALVEAAVGIIFRV